MKDNRKRVIALLHFALCIFLIFFSACGSGSGTSQNTSSDTGSIGFSVEWNGAPTIEAFSASVRGASLDCQAAGVSTVEGKIYDEDNNFLGGDARDCEAHSGRITGVRAGINRKLVILAKDPSGNVLYRGEVIGITVTAGQRTNAGTIVADLFNPTLLTPSDGSTVTNGAFSFEWASVIGASEYQIQVSPYSGFTSTVIDETVTTTSYAPTTTLSVGTHYWRVKAKDAYGNGSQWSEVWDFTISAEPGTAPSEPENVSTIAGDEKVTISWDSVTGATSYGIYMHTSTGVSKTNFTEKRTVTTTSYTWTSLTNDTTYYYILTAENDYGESDESDEISATPSAIGTAPSAPENVTVIAQNGKTTISWDSVYDSTSYNIYWSTSPGVSKDSYEGKIADITDISYTHTGLTNDTTYYYILTAENDYGETDESDEISATPSVTGEAPSTPTAVTPTAGDEEVTISWDTVYDSTSYNIYWSTSSGVSKDSYEGKISSIPETSYTHTGVTNDTTYYLLYVNKNPKKIWVAG